MFWEFAPAESARHAPATSKCQQYAFTQQVPVARANNKLVPGNARPRNSQLKNFRRRTTAMAEKKENTNNKYEGMSASKAKRERQKAERAAAKRNAAMGKVTLAIVVCAFIGVIAAIFGKQWYMEANKTEPSTDYSAMLNDDGSIKDVNVKDYVKTFDINAVKIAKADVEYTDDELQEDINTALENHKTLNSDKALAIKDGDEVDINYVGTMDGVEFEGGSADNYALTIGSGSFIDDFETQLIGHHPGEQMTVNVTFPDPYENNPDYAGKEASFAVTINGIYELPVFDDAFVKANLSENAQTVEEYKQYLKDTNYKTKLDSAVSQYVTDNISADKYPKNYVKHLKALQMTLNENQFNYMQQMYTAYGMSFDYSSVMEYFGAKNTQEYEKVLQDAAEKNCLSSMAYQDLAAQAGITVSDEQYEAFKTENNISEETASEYGRPYIVQQYILPDLVNDYIAEHATVE